MLRLATARLGAVGTGGRSLSALAGPRDQVHLRGLIFHGHHGVYEEERKLGQKFRIDVTLDTCLADAGKSDDLKDAINYAIIYKTVEGVVTGPPAQLLECVAERIASAILSSQSRVNGVRVEVAKPHVAVGGVVEGLGISIYRPRVAV
ncbi:hypothetical protein ACKKBG_A03380 [Auxenochlorella protothecoides x Auxenochlorella symbiontica]